MEVLLEALRVLEGSFLSIQGNRVTFLNPSLKDYLASYLTDSELLCRLAPTAKTIVPRPASNQARLAGVPGAMASRPRSAMASPARVGATIGVLERLLIVALVLTNATAAVGFVIAAKTIARFKQLDDRQFAEYYLLGTLASVAVAVGSSLVAAAALP